MRFYTATTNDGKLSEFAELMRATGHELEVLDPIEVPEDRGSFEGNARQKAEAYASEAEGMAFAEDSGLIIPALDGDPGERSARYAVDKGLIDPEEATDQEIDEANNRAVLNEMKGKKNRQAAFVAVIVAMEPNGDLFEDEAWCLGHIAKDPRGSEGFGYDPIFEEAETGLTFAELDKARKNLVSHRRKVMRKFKEWLALYDD